MLYILFGVFVRHPAYFIVVAVVSLCLGASCAMLARARHLPVSKSQLCVTACVVGIWLHGAANEQRMLDVGGNPIRVDLLLILGFGWIALLLQVAVTVRWFATVGTTDRAA